MNPRAIGPCLLGILLPIRVAAAQPARAAPCEALLGLSLSETKITAASTNPGLGGSGPFCQVVGVATPTGHSVIGFEVWLPPAGSWNGKLQAVGSGGSAGSINTGGLTAALSGADKKYAAMATDNGHKGSSWTFAHPFSEKVVDFGYRAEHVSTVAAKAIVTAFYGSAPEHAYFVGCSQGGHHALMAAQRFPEDFDGIVAGDPANNWTNLMVGELWAGLVAGLKDPANSLPQAKLDVLMNAVLLACDGNDGVVDGIIEDPRTCHFDPASLRCAGADAPDCLTTGQIEAVNNLYAGASNRRTGAQIFPGFVNGSENAWRQVLVGLPIPGGSSYSYFRDGVFADPAWNFRAFDFDRDVTFAATRPAGAGTYPTALDANDADLRPFARAGGKLILYHGWADPFITPTSTINYYEKVLSVFGGRGDREEALERAQRFARLFMVPGLWHCAGGPGPNKFDMLSALESWVEQGEAPKKIIGTKYVKDDPTMGVILTRPLCVYPQTARYLGGNPSEAASFSCGAADEDRSGGDHEGGGGEGGDRGGD